MPANVDQLLDRIFGDPQVKHKLDLFTLQEKNRLQLFEKADRIRIRCMVRDRDFVAKPEEVVRQLVLIHLHYSLGYPIDQLAVEVPVQMGSGVGTKAADVVVYRDPQKIIPYIIAEVKKPGRQDGREQLHSYMNATGAPFGMWTNGGTGKQGVAYEYRTDPNLFADLPRLPAQGETLDDVLEPIRKKDLQPAEDLIGLVKQMQEEVLANAGVNVFEEVFKLFFVKLWDEENASDDPNALIKATGMPGASWKKLNTKLKL
jgi:type I restriction enzyme M protein